MYALSHDYVLYIIHSRTNTGVSKFRVHMKESENLPVSGPVDLVVSEDGITLLSIQTGKNIFNRHWSKKFSGGKGTKFRFLRCPGAPSKIIVKSV